MRAETSTQSNALAAPFRHYTQIIAATPPVPRYRRDCLQVNAAAATLVRRRAESS